MFKVELLVDDGGEVFQDSEGEPYDRTIDFKVEERDDEWKPLNFTSPSALVHHVIDAAKSHCQRLNFNAETYHLRVNAQVEQFEVAFEVGVDEPQTTDPALESKEDLKPLLLSFSHKGRPFDKEQRRMSKLDSFLAQLAWPSAAPASPEHEVEVEVEMEGAAEMVGGNGGTTNNKRREEERTTDTERRVRTRTTTDESLSNLAQVAAAAAAAADGAVLTSDLDDESEIQDAAGKVEVAEAAQNKRLAEMDQAYQRFRTQKDAESRASMERAIAALLAAQSALALSKEKKAKIESAVSKQKQRRLAEENVAELRQRLAVAEADLATRREEEKAAKEQLDC